MEKEITRKSIFLTNWKSKIGYSLNYKDIKELETIIDYYETQLKKQKEINDKAIEYVKGHKYTMRHQWDKTNSYKWGIAVFNYDKEEDYWYLRTFGDFNQNIDWYDFGCLVNLGYKWIEELGWNK